MFNATNRRKILTTTALVAAGTILGGLSSCPQTSQPIDISQLIANLINNIQQSVRALLLPLCPTLTTISTLIPTADSVMAFIVQAVGGPVTAANVATVVADVEKYINSIVALGCPTPPPAAGKFSASLNGKVNGKDITINYY